MISPSSLIELKEQLRALNAAISEIRENEILAAYKAPTVIEADENNELNPSLGATVTVDYEHQDLDAVTLHWLGSNDSDTWISEAAYVTSGKTPIFNVPIQIISNSAGREIDVLYTVYRNGIVTSSRLLELKVLQADGSSGRFYDVNFHNYEPGDVQSPFKLAGLTVECENMKITYNKGLDRNELQTIVPCTLIFEKEISVCAYNYTALSTGMKMKAMTIDGDVIDEVSYQSQERRNWLGKKGQQKIQKIHCNSGCEWSRLLFN
ncbi:hypothetical protein [Pseudomonas sp. H9]|uniref:hypothetical protein n=1 Tax=Pseudomonas sp. H9 TaxID=483968 RepID=UPI00105811C6|nr:hypothetical protein [Pseudomonas sp. H9]TDF84390.1 hypothetical protein E1573_07620 [Pseudomonas sp. H9]